MPAFSMADWRVDFELEAAMIDGLHCNSPIPQAREPARVGVEAGQPAASTRGAQTSR
jgi:hypothetical protein